MNREMDYETLKRKYENLKERERYWKNKARANDNGLGEKIGNIMEADPEFKWYALWLGAGAIEALLRGDLVGFMTETSATPDPRGDINNWTSYGNDVWVYTATGEKFYGPDPTINYRTNQGVSKVPQGFKFTDLAIGTFSPAYLMAKALDLGLAGGTSMTALSMIIIGRIEKTDDSATPTLPVG